MSQANAMSRRGFVTGLAALGVAAVGLAGCAPKASSGERAEGLGVGAVPETWDMEADVVILGAGGAGAAAACTAKEAGASVLVLEKANVIGGDTALSGQSMLGPWPEQQKAIAGIDDSVESYLDDMKNSYRWGAFAEQGREFPGEYPFTRLQSDLTADMMNWTTDVIGVGWTPSGMADDPVTEGVLPQPTWDTKNCRTWMAMDPTNSVMKAFGEALGSMDVDVRLRTEADRLVVNEDGRVVGVYAYDENDKVIAVKAARAVIVATGSFCSNRGMMERYLPISKGIQGGGCYGATGDGMRMVRAIGGSLSEMDLGVHWYPFEAGTNSGQFSTTLILFGGPEGSVPISQQPGVMLNYDGERFVSESNGYHLIGRAIAQQECQEAWYVFDSHKGAADMILDVIPYNNRVVRAETLEELCTILRLPFDTVRMQIDDYNSAIEKGEDLAFEKLLDGCQSIDQGPFFALNIRPRPYATYGGVDTDLDARVLDANGNAICGLYAAGIVTGSYAAREGFYYNGGLAQALVFGRLAGKNAAAEDAWEQVSPTGSESRKQDVSTIASCSDCHGDGRAPGEPNYHGF